MEANSVKKIEAPHLMKLYYHWNSQKRHEESETVHYCRLLEAVNDSEQHARRNLMSAQSGIKSYVQRPYANTF